MYNLAIRKCTSPPLLAPRLKIYKLKFTTLPGIEPWTCWTRGRHATIWANVSVLHTTFQELIQLRWLRHSRLALWSLLNYSGLDGRGLLVCWNPDCRCRRHLIPKSRRLPFSGFLPLDVSSPAVGDIFRSGRCRCVRCRGSHSLVIPVLFSLANIVIHKNYHEFSYPSNKNRLVKFLLINIIIK